MLESLVDKVAKSPTRVFFCETSEIFKNTYFESICERLLLTGSK